MITVNGCSGIIEITQLDLAILQVVTIAVTSLCSYIAPYHHHHAALPLYKLLISTNTSTRTKPVSLVPLQQFSLSIGSTRFCLVLAVSSAQGLPCYVAADGYPEFCRSALSTTGSVVRGRPLQHGTPMGG